MVHNGGYGEPLWNSNHIWLVVEPYPSEKSWSSSVGMIIPNIWKNKSHVPNHQSDYFFFGGCNDNGPLKPSLAHDGATLDMCFEVS